MYVVEGKFTLLYIAVRPAFLLALHFLNRRTSVSLLLGSWATADLRGAEYSARRSCWMKGLLSIKTKLNSAHTRSVTMDSKRIGIVELCCVLMFPSRAVRRLSEWKQSKWTEYVFGEGLHKLKWRKHPITRNNAILRHLAYEHDELTTHVVL